jgi:hypothetical protein
MAYHPKFFLFLPSRGTVMATKILAICIHRFPNRGTQTTPFVETNNDAHNTLLLVVKPLQV